MNVFIFLSKMGLDQCSRIDLNDYLMFQMGFSVELLEIHIETQSHSYTDEISWKWLTIGVHYLLCIRVDMMGLFCILLADMN